MTEPSTLPLLPPGRGRGMLDIPRSRYLLRLVVRKDVQVRYRGSWLGILWSYIKPAVQFLVFYVAIGVFLGMNKGFPNYAIYLFAGIAGMNYFNEAFGNAARSVVGNGGLIKKIYIPRMLFPVSAIWVAVVHFVPGLIVLLVGCLIVGWAPSLLSVAAILAGFVLITVFALGLGLLFGFALQRALSEQGLTELALPWAQLGISAVVALIVGVLAGVWPAARASRLDVLDAIAAE